MTTMCGVNSSLSASSRLTWLAPLLVAVTCALSVACGESEESRTSPSDAGGAPSVAAEQPTNSASDREDADSSQLGPTFASKFSTPDEPKERGDLMIATLLPRDAIPSIDSPKFVDVEIGSQQMDDENLIIGVSIEEDHRAYSTAFLSSHEIVNDLVGGKPVAVTW